MLSSNKRQVTSTVHHRPRLSTVVDRRRIMRPTVGNGMVLKKDADKIVRRTQEQISTTPVDIRKQQNNMNVQKTKSDRPTAKQIKETAIEKAIAAADKESPTKNIKKTHARFGFKRVLLALLCAATAVFAIVYFVNLNAPDISLRVAAMQTGIEASYPSYIPRDFSLSDITSENGKVTLNFKNPSNGDAFLLVEEKSSWDSNTLLNNYVREAFGEDYTVIREQGLTIYIDGGDATWVNGGIIYKLDSTSGSLTKKQIRAIAVSL